MRVRNSIEKPIKKYVKAEMKQSTGKPVGRYCPKEIGCCYNHQPSRKKKKEQEV